MNQIWTRYLPAFIRKNIEGRHELQKAIGNTGWLFADNILRMGIGLLVSIWVTRYLGPEQFGQLNYAVAFVGLFSTIALLGLDGIVIRNLVRDPGRKEEILGTAFLLKLAAALITCGLIMTAILLLHSTDHLTCLLVGITSMGLVFQSFGIIDFFFQSQIQSKFSAYSKSAAFLTCSFIKIVLIIYHAPLEAFALVGVVEIIFGSLGLIVAYRTCGNRLTDWRSNIPTAKELLRDSWPLIFTEIVITIYMRVDKILIGEMAGNSELGIYAVAAVLAEALYFIPLSISSSLFPGIVAAKENNEALFQERLQRFYNIMAFSGYAVAVPMTFVASWLVPLLYGPAYVRAAQMLVGLAWASLFINLGFARSYYLTAMNWTRLHFITDFLGCATNILLNIILIPRYGAMGSVIASVLSYWLATHGSCFFFRPLNKTGLMITKAIFYPKFW